MKLTVDQLEKISQCYKIDEELKQELLEEEYSSAHDVATVICDAIGVERRGNRRTITDIIETVALINAPPLV